MNLSLLQRQYSDVVQVRNRSSKTVEFMFDGKIYKFKGTEKKNVPRFIAEAGFNRLPIKMDLTNGIILESFLYFEGCGGPESNIDFTPESIQEKPKYDLPKNMNVDGHQATMKPVKLSAQKETFANQGSE